MADETPLPADSDRRTNPERPPFTKEDPGAHGDGPKPVTENPHREWRPSLSN
jgi:hypothetical protein